MDNKLKLILMMPARLGSQRLKKKNLIKFNGRPLLLHNLIKARQLDIFTKIYVNTESNEIGKVATENGFDFYKRDKKLANSKSTSESFVYDFLKNVDCDYLIQLHSIAPLITKDEIISFIEYLTQNNLDTLLSYQKIQIECLLGKSPINFNLEKKENSQELEFIKRISWAITGWKRSSYINSYENRKCATYNGKIDFFEISEKSSMVIKDIDDFNLIHSIYNAK